MPEASKTPRQQLDDWERRVKEHVGEGDILLGELGFSRQDLEQIGQLLADTEFWHLREKRRSIEQTLRHIATQWPLTYALFLVLQGIHNYESGDYWDGPSKQLGLQNIHTSDCGQLFLKVLAQHDLPTFEQSGGLAYVTPILLHGGIPNDRLPEFFDFLWRNEKRPHNIALDTKSLLQLWRQQTDDYFRYLSKPVQRFLQDGDLVAEDLVDRCLDLFDTDSPEETEGLVDLPPRIIRAYWRWRNEKGIQTHSTAPRIRLQKPILTIAPYNANVGFYLPPQQFSNRAAPNQLMWRIVADDHPEQIVNCNPQRIEGGNQFLAEQPSTILPAKAYQLHLETADNTLQLWTIPAFGDPPILFFLPYDDYEGDALVDQERFRPGERWLLYPEQYTWKTIGRSRKLRDLPRLTGNWRGYKLELWQLSPGEMVLLDGDGREHPFGIIHETVRPRPHFIGGDRLPLPTSAVDFPLYIGCPPSIALYTSQPHRWRLLIRAAGASQPGEPRSFKLSQLVCESVENGLRLDLSQPELLGEMPFGKFEIVLRGPLGRNYQLGLRLIPSLTVVGLDKLYLDNANQVAEYQFTCSSTTTIRQNPPQSGVELQEIIANEEHRQYRLKARPDIQRLNLQLRHESVIIPLTIPIRRLRWGLQHGQEKTVSWQTAPSAIYPGSLQNAALWVDIPVTKETQLRVGWRLINGAGEIGRVLPPGDQPVQHQLHWPLNELTAVWRERQETLCWQLLIQQSEVYEPLVIPAFYLLPTLDFGALDYDWQTSDDHTRLTLIWEHSRPGSYQLQLWPLDRPWIKEPLRLLLPETNDTLVEWRLTTKELPAEAYLAELIAYNPWQSSQPQRPQSGALNSLLIKPPGLSQHYVKITRLRDRGEASIEQLLALLAHQFYNHQQHEMHQTNKAIADQKEALSLTWLVRWLELAATLNKNAYTLAQIRAFDAAIIDRLAQQSWSDDELDVYFNHLPNNKLSEKVYTWIIQSGIQRPRRRCLIALCRLTTDTPEREIAVQAAIHAVLEDIGDGALLLREAVNLLIPNALTATNWLAQNGGLDAADLLHELTISAHLTPNWIAPKIQIKTNLGIIRVEKLRHRASNEIRFCASLNDNCYAEGELLTKPTAVPIRLDLRNKQLCFTRTEPYQCRHCHQLFTSLADYSQHHQIDHAAQPQMRKRLKRDCSISLLAVTLPGDDPAINLEEATK